MTTTWVFVAARDHARRGVALGFVMANHGKRAPLARLAVGDRIVIYSPRTDFPDGAPLKAITAVGTVTGEEPVPSDAIPGGFRRAASLRELADPVPLASVRDHLPTSRLRFGAFALTDEQARGIWAALEG